MDPTTGSAEQVRPLQLHAGDLIRVHHEHCTDGACVVGCAETTVKVVPVPENEPLAIGSMVPVWWCDCSRPEVCGVSVMDARSHVERVGHAA